MAAAESHVLASVGIGTGHSPPCSHSLLCCESHFTPRFSILPLPTLSSGGEGAARARARRDGGGGALDGHCGEGLRRWCDRLRSQR